MASLALYYNKRCWHYEKLATRSRIMALCKLGSLARCGALEMHIPRLTILCTSFISSLQMSTYYNRPSNCPEEIFGPEQHIQRFSFGNRNNSLLVSMWPL